jgi:hypothetical protein
MAEKITRWNMYQYSIADQMEYRRSRREEAQAIIDSNAQLANSFATISSNKSIGEGDLFSRIAMERMTGTKVSKSA